MFVYLLLAFNVVLLSWLLQRWLSTRSYWKSRDVPHRPPHPLLGSLTFLQRQNMVEWLRDEYQKYSGSPYFGIWLFWRPALVVRDPALARRVLIKDFHAFKDRYLGSGKSDPIGGQNIFTVNDPLWSSVRRRLTSVFTAAKLRALHPLISEKTTQLVQRIRQDYVDDNKHMDLREMYADFTTDIIGAAAFGVAGDATLTGSSIMRSVTQVFSSYSTKRGLEFAAIFFWPGLCDIFRVKFFTRKTTAFFRELFQKIVSQRGGWDAKVTETRDLLDALIRLKQESKVDGDEISEDVIIAQAAIFLHGGFDTSAVALTLTTYELAYHPEIQEKLYAELIEAKAKAEGNLDLNILAELPYLACVIKETLRKYPAMGYLDRIATQDYKVDDKLTITKGTPVYVCGIGMHYDPEYYPEPYEYKPERFLSQNEANSFTFLPFGDGPRNCIGMRFAYQTMRSALANVVLSYKIRPISGGVKPRDIRTDPRSIFLAPDRELAVQFVLRD